MIKQFTLLSIFVFCILVAGNAQIITTVVGGGIGNGPDPLAALISPMRILLHKGSLYIAETDASRIRKIDADGNVSTIAGNGKEATRPLLTGGPATATSLMYPVGMAFDSHDNMYISDVGANAIFKIDAQGIFTRVAGIDTSYAYGGDGGPATAAYFLYPISIAIDKDDNILVADGGRIRKISGGIINTVAGGGGLPLSGTPVPATAAELKSISNIAVDRSGNVFIVATDGLVKFSTAGMVGKLASNDTSTNSYITGCNADEYGNVYYYFKGYIMRIDVNNIITIDRQATLENVVSMAYENGRAQVATNPIYPEEIGAIYTVRPGDITIKYAGSSNNACDGATGDNANIGYPLAVANDAAGNLFISEQPMGSHPFRIRKLNKNGVISTLNDYGVRITDMCTDRNNNLYLMCPAGFIYKVVPGGDTMLYAGVHSGGDTTDNISATNAKLGTCRSIATDRDGNLYVSCGYFIKKISKAGIISTIAGNGLYSATLTEDGVPATATNINTVDITVDKDNNIYLLEFRKIRKITTDGIIHVIGGCDACTTPADGVPAVNAIISVMVGNDIIVDTADNIYFSDRFHIRRIDASGIISKVAGIDSAGFSGDGGDADSAKFNYPQSISLDDSGRLYVADFKNYRIRRINTMYRFPPPSIDSSGSVKIFPNPASTAIMVTWYSESQGNTVWNIYDAVGRNVISGVAEPVNCVVNETIALPAQLPQGVYLFRRAGAKASRFIIAR